MLMSLSIDMVYCLRLYKDATVSGLPIVSCVFPLYILRGVLRCSDIRSEAKFHEHPIITLCSHRSLDLLEYHIFT